MFSPGVSEVLTSYTKPSDIEMDVTPRCSTDRS